MKVPANHRNHSHVSRMGDFIADRSHRPCESCNVKKKKSQNIVSAGKLGGFFNVMIKNSMYLLYHFYFLHFDNPISV